MNKKHYSPKIALIGDICVDISMQVEAYPQMGGDCIGQKLTLEIGGSVTNTAISLAHLGAKSQLIGHVGSDILGAQVLHMLNREGVITRNIKAIKSDATGVTIVTVTPDGEKTMVTYRGANTHLAPREISKELLAGMDMLHLSGYALLTSPQSEALIHSVELAREMDIGVSIDISPEPAQKAVDRLIGIIPSLKLIILGRPEICAIAGKETLDEALGFLIGMSPPLIIALKVGKYGCQIFKKGEVFSIPAFPVEVVDTTGAGDAFSAGMVYGIATGMDLISCATLANVMGALSSAVHGAGTSLPGREDLEKYLMCPENQTGQSRAAILEILDMILSSQDPDQEEF